MTSIIGRYIEDLRSAMSFIKAKREERQDARERAAIAKVFNDRYTYRKLFDPTAERLPGSGLHGFTPKGGNRWMCPECNKVHAPLSCSMWSGLQFPRCCGSGEGHRLDADIRKE